MAADGQIRIDIEVDGKQISVASRELDKLEESGLKSGKGLKAAENSMDGLSDKSSKAGSSVKGAGNAIEGLGDSGSKAGKGLKGADGAIDSLADSSSSASSSVKGAKDAIDSLGDSGSKAGAGLKGADSAIDGIADSSANAISSVKGVSDSLSGLSDSGSKASNDLKSADGAIDGVADRSAQAASGVKGFSDSLDGVSDKAAEAANSTQRVKEEAGSVSQETVKASIGFKELATSLGLVAIASKAFNTLQASLDSAIARFDTLNAFPKVLQALGVSAEDAERAMDRLSDGIDGLPTTLNDIAGSAQRMYTSFSDMDKATDTAIALNNALLGSGSSAEAAQRGADQYIKALQSGKIQMDTWNTLSETMDVGLIKIAEGFGFAGKSAKDDLYKALQSGSITLDQFNDKLIEVGTGTGIMATLAKENSLGIATSLSNLGNSAARGVANIIESFNKLAKETTGKDIAQNIDGLKVIVNSSFKMMGSAIEGAAPIVKMFASTVQMSIPVVQALTPAILGLVAAYGAYTVITKAGAAIATANEMIGIAQAATKTLTILTSAQVAAQMAGTKATQADTVAKAAQTGAVTLSTYAIGLLTGQITLFELRTKAATTATYAFAAAKKFLTGPIGWVVAGIGLLTAGIIAVVNWYKRSTEEATRLNAETEKLGDSTSGLADTLNSSAEAYKNNQNAIESNAKSYSDLSKTVEELAAKENKSAADKLLLKESIEQLNGSVEGLNLSYNEEANALSMSSEQLQARIKLMQDQEAATAGQERLLEISKEQHEVEQKLAETNELREEWNRKLEEGSIKSREHKDALAELGEQEDSLRQTFEELAIQHKETEVQMVASIGAVTEATQSGVSDQKISLGDLSESQQATVESMKSTWEDYKNQATDMFDVLSEKSEVSVGKMTKNLEENQRIITKWSENIAKLAERGVDEGLLETLRAAGPESAGHVNALVKASDSELEKLSTAFAKGGDVATDALSKSLGIEKSGVMEAVGHLVTGTEKALADSIKSADFESLGVDIAKGQAGGIEKGTPEAEKAAKKMAKATEDAARKQSEIHSPSRVFMRIGGDLADGLVLGVNQGTAKVIQAIQKMFRSVQDTSAQSFNIIVKDYDLSVDEIKKSLERLPVITQESMNKMLNKLKSGTTPQIQVMRALAKDLPNSFDRTPSQFETIGREAMAGLNRGLQSGEGQVMSTANSIANRAAATMRKALDIHSPSRVFMEIGEFIGEGLELGILSSKEANEKAVKDVGQAIKKATDNNAVELNKIADKAEKERTAVQQEFAKKRIELERKTSQTIQAAMKTSKNKKGKIVKASSQKIHNTRAEATAKLRKLEEDEQKKLAKINEKAWNDLVKKEAEVNKERLDNIKQYVADKKSTEELSLVAEVAVWERGIRAFKEGTKERIEAQKQYKAAVDAVNKELTSTNQEYSEKMKKINDDLKKQEADLTSAYEKSLEDRTKALLSFANTFDAVNIELNRTGQELMGNLESQVDAFKKWQEEFGKLSERGIDKDLLNELSGLGVKALPELVALNSMTDEQLTKYSELYREKSQLARQQAEKELEGMKKDTDKKILELRQIAEGQLNKLHIEWMLKIKNLTATTASELSTLRQIGVDAGQGLLDGLASMEGPLIDKAQQIADGIKSAIQGALDIHSPSRWMRDFVAGNMAKGFSLGVDKNKALLMKSANRFGDIIKPSPINHLSGARAMQGVSNMTSNRYDIDKSRTMHAQVTVQSQEDKAAYERMMRRLAFELGL